MTYRMTGLAAEKFVPLFALGDSALANHDAVRVTADSDNGFPCRVSLEDAKAGERLILLNYTSNDIAGPYRSAYAIYVREGAVRGDAFVDAIPPSLRTRPLSLRAFGADNMVVTARLIDAGAADGAIRHLFSDGRIAYIMAHYAAYGCFAARIDRHGDLG